MVCLLGTVDGRIYGAQFGTKPFILTVLCPPDGKQCVLDIQTVPTARVQSSRYDESGVVSYDLFWKSDERVQFVHALNFMRVFREEVGVDGLGNIKFDVTSEIASLELSVSAGLRARVMLLSSGEAATLCAKLQCEE
ncbi:hypothetical protein FOL47_008849 [Perkinsus chesapeaki]|uniref:Uncharacterized protein n=1 Tax=Perkinsus chesapeaki TaxID=330153 RepID=A0A7J6LBF3_PERCH|nr:hypothetical protein FOL47_008849 [Perkinsus chesapeaki]